MLCCIEKSTKIVPTCFRKQVSNRCSKLHQFYNQLGSILGWFWLPFWLQVASKLLQKSIAKLIKKPMPCCRDFLSTFGRFWHQIGPQLGAKNVCYVDLCWLLGPSWSQDGPWSPQETLGIDFGPPQEAPQPPLGPIWEQTWHQLGIQNRPTISPKSLYAYVHVCMYTCMHDGCLTQQSQARWRIGRRQLDTYI